MKIRLLPLAAPIVLACAVTQPLFAETVETKGTVCWTGDISYIGTGEADMGYVWDIDWTYLPGNADLQMAASGTCNGSGFVIAGTPEDNPYFCKHTRADGATHMSRVEATNAGGTSTMFGGTGALAGAKGESTFGAAVQIPAEAGRISGCRAVDGFYTTGE